MKFIFYTISLLILTSASLRDKTQIHFGAYKNIHNQQKWVLDPPVDDIFQLKCNMVGCSQVYTFRSNDCDDDDKTITVCSSDNKNYRLTFSDPGNISNCDVDNKYRTMTMTSGKIQRFVAQIDCNE